MSAIFIVRSNNGTRWENHEITFWFLPIFQVSIVLKCCSRFSLFGNKNDVRQLVELARIQYSFSSARYVLEQFFYMILCYELFYHYANE